MLSNASCLSLNHVPGFGAGAATFGMIMTIITITTGCPGESG